MLGQLIPETSINKIGYLKEMIISESNRTYANLASLAFLSANINSNLKQLAISLTNKLAEVISDHGAWSIDNNQLDKLKQSKINFPHDLRLYFYKNSNALLMDYQNLLDIKKEIDQKIDDFEATGSSPT